MNLDQAIERTCEWLRKSEPTDWSPLEPSEVVDHLKAIQHSMRRGASWDYSKLELEFAVTSTIQEIAMFNGWHDEYLRLAAIVDDHRPGGR